MGATEKTVPHVQRPRILCSGGYVHDALAGVLSDSVREARREPLGREDIAMCTRGQGWCRGNKRPVCGRRDGRLGPVLIVSHWLAYFRRLYARTM